MMGWVLVGIVGAWLGLNTAILALAVWVGGRPEREAGPMRRG